DIEKINPIIYKWKSETGYDTLNNYAGFSAQNVQSAIPEAVGTSSSGFLNLADRPILAAVVNAVKEVGASLKNLIANTITATVGHFGTVKIDNGIEIKDHSTGEIYCVTISNGDWLKIKGDCSSIDSTTTLTQTISTATFVASPTSNTSTSTTTDTIISTSTDTTTTTSTSTPPTPVPEAVATSSDTVATTTAQ
ncbi:MAG: tail fiber domain-containing protein, partial [Candidatus Paceibacterota bacterium]